MTVKTYDKIIASLILLRGEDGCEKACKVLKENYKVDKVKEIPHRYAHKILDKLECEITFNNVKTVFEGESITCPNCGKDAYKKGMFFICSHCHKVIE